MIKNKLKILRYKLTWLNLIKKEQFLKDFKKNDDRQTIRKPINGISGNEQFNISS